MPNRRVADLSPSSTPQNNGFDPDGTLAEWLASSSQSAAVPAPAPVAKTCAPQPEPSRELVDALVNIAAYGRDSGADRTRGTVVLSAGGGGLALWAAEHRRKLTMVHPNAVVIESAKAHPLGSYGTILRTLKTPGYSSPQFHTSPIRPSMRFVNAPLHETALPSASFNRVIIEQAHRAELPQVIEEARRLASPNAPVALFGYMPMSVTPEINRLLGLTYRNVLCNFLTPGETQLLSGFRTIEFPLQEQKQLGCWALSFRARMRMVAKWDLATLIEHIDDWPVIRRIEQGMWAQVAIWSFRKELAAAWGPKRRKMQIAWPIHLRVGYAV